jgi:hypothetical protein
MHVFPVYITYIKYIFLGKKEALLTEKAEQKDAQWGPEAVYLPYYTFFDLCTEP